MKLNNKQKKEIEKLWFWAGRLEKNWIVLSNSLSISFRCYSELHDTVEVFIEKLSVKKGIDLVRSFYAQSPEFVIKQIEKL